MSLGQNIRYLRIKRGYSQEYIAEQLGYKSYTTIQKWESGVSEPPIKKLRELATLLNVDMDDLATKDLSNIDYIVQLDSDVILTIETKRVAKDICDHHPVLFDIYCSSDRDRLISYAMKLKELQDRDNEDK